MNNKLIESYKQVAGEEAIDQLFQLVEPLRGIKITHVSSTFTGGGVAEILAKLVPLTQSLGIETNWEIIQGSTEFFQCTKSFHNALQGMQIVIPQSKLDLFESNNRENAEFLQARLKDSDVVFIHDPQPLAMIKYLPQRKGKWIWRCHIDASKPNRTVWKYLKQFIELYDATVFSLAEFTHPINIPMFIIPPSIDPLSEKNRDLDKQEIDAVYDRFGIDSKRPMLLQVSRYDRFKDPVGVIQAYNIVKKIDSRVQLVLVGGGAADDPESEVVISETKAAAGDDRDIHILVLPNDAHRTINALQRAADIVLQKSIKEGFGLTVTESLWKGKPVIGGNTGGICLQIINGQTGYVVNTPEGAAYRIRYLLQHKAKGIELGIHGKEYVREKFLITRHIREYLSLIYSLIFPGSNRVELPGSKHIIGKI